MAVGCRVPMFFLRVIHLQGGTTIDDFYDEVRNTFSYMARVSLKFLDTLFLHETVNAKTRSGVLVPFYGELTWSDCASRSIVLNSLTDDKPFHPRVTPAFLAMCRLSIDEDEYVVYSPAISVCCLWWVKLCGFFCA